MVNILLTGCCGKMGDAVTASAENNENINIVGGIDIRTDITRNYPVFKSFDEIENINNNEENDINLNSYVNEKDFFTKKNKYFYQVKINKIKLKIYKIFPNLEKTLFLDSYFEYFNYIMCGNSINDSLMKISIKILKLIDKEKGTYVCDARSLHSPKPGSCNLLLIGETYALSMPGL